MPMAGWHPQSFLPVWRQSGVFKVEGLPLFSGVSDRFAPSFGHFSLARISQLPSIMSRLLQRECELSLQGNASILLKRSPELFPVRLNDFGKFFFFFFSFTDTLNNIDTSLMGLVFCIDFSERSG